MACYRPLRAYVTHNKTDNGKDEIVFTKPNRIYKELDLPCGQCIGCRLSHANQWAIRCYHESTLHDTNCFITLTYDDKHLPNDYSLRKDHAQKFIKRLRKTLYPKKISYYLCGEYGDTTWRPHFHALIFGYDFPDKIKIQNTEVENPYYLSQTLTKLWNKGNHLIADVSPENCAYTTRYCVKKITGDAQKDHYTRTIIDIEPVTGEVLHYAENVELEPEFALMSRKPAIGKNWYAKYKSDCYPSSYLVTNGKKHGIPKYYDKLLQEEDEARLQQIKLKRKFKAAKRAADQTRARLFEIEKCKTQQQKTLKRNKQ